MKTKHKMMTIKFIKEKNAINDVANTFMKIFLTLLTVKLTSYGPDLWTFRPKKLVKKEEERNQIPVASLRTPLPNSDLSLFSVCPKLKSLLSSISNSNSQFSISQCLHFLRSESNPTIQPRCASNSISHCSNRNLDLQP